MYCIICIKQYQYREEADVEVFGPYQSQESIDILESINKNVLDLHKNVYKNSIKFYKKGLESQIFFDMYDVDPHPIWPIESNEKEWISVSYEILKMKTIHCNKID